VPTLGRRFAGAIVISSVVLAFILNALYTTWTVHAEFSKSCALIQAQATSTFYPPEFRHDFAVLARQRGC